METTRPPGFPGNPPARMPRAPTPARSPPPRPLRRGEMTFRPTHDVGPRTQCISGLNYAAYGLPVNASRPGSPQAHASLGSGWRPTLAGWDWIPTGFRTRFRRSHHGILSPLTGLSRHTRWCVTRSRACLAGSRWSHPGTARGPSLDHRPIGALFSHQTSGVEPRPATARPAGTRAHYPWQGACPGWHVWTLASPSTARPSPKSGRVTGPLPCRHRRPLERCAGRRYGRPVPPRVAPRPR